MHKKIKETFKEEIYKAYLSNRSQNHLKNFAKFYYKLCDADVETARKYIHATINLAIEDQNLKKFIRKLFFFKK